MGRNQSSRWAVGHGFRPLAHQQALLAAAALPPSAVIPSLTAPRPALLRDKVLADEPLVKAHHEPRLSLGGAGRTEMGEGEESAGGQGRGGD